MNIIEIYGDVLKEKDARITALESENAALKRHLSNMDHVLDKRIEYIVALKRELAVYKKEIERRDDLLAKEASHE